jgi:hypothetical protein
LDSKTIAKRQKAEPSRRVPAKGQGDNPMKPRLSKNVVTMLKELLPNEEVLIDNYIENNIDQIIEERYNEKRD